MPLKSIPNFLDKMSEEITLLNHNSGDIFDNGKSLNQKIILDDVLVDKITEKNISMLDI